jgi:hypothetical protein
VACDLDQADRRLDDGQREQADQQPLELTAVEVEVGEGERQQKQIGEDVLG